ncbi:helicase-related protein [Arthrobacter sp. 31Y]|uniref:helicase-related protein n=1 Tax=Arthrobacter sp. 31Y TaxID=1115632 RepID=UPI0004660904|nr:helicase-related protein [Arthrobacter sp. 31Y]
MDLDRVPASGAVPGRLAGIPLDFRPGVQVLPPSGAKSRASANMEALRLLHQLQSERRHATGAEQDVLARWSSWGAVPQIFEEHREEWAHERAELKSLLSAEEYAQASATTINAHYTDPAVVKALWDCLQGSGFDRGVVLEPGCGAGNFIGQAPESAVMAGVELDSTTAAIASFLYPAAHVRAAGFQDTTIPEGSVSAVVGNVPFGDFVVHDARYNTSRLSIHNYFIAKSLRLTAPGGYVAVLTSTFTMDAQGTKARREIAKYGDLVGAVRLPNNAFKTVAGTEVATDLLVFRRRKADERPDEDRINAWVQPSTTWATHRETGEPTQVAIGGWFAANDDAVLGVLSVGRGMYNDATISIDGPSGAVLADEIRDKLTTQLAEATTAGYGYAPVPVPAPEGTFPAGLHRGSEEAEAVTGHVRYLGGAFERFNASRLWEPVKVPAARREEVVALLAVRDQARAVIDSQRSGAPEDERDALRRDLNAAYDAYSWKYGPINRFVLREKPPTSAVVSVRLAALEKTWRLGLPADGDVPASEVPVPASLLAAWKEEASIAEDAVRKQEHLAVLKGDPGRGLLLALEHFDEETGLARKAAVFDRDVLAFRERPTSAASAADALAISLDESRIVDLDRIAGLLEVDPTRARDLLGTLVFEDPATGELLPAVKYLSGDVRAKLEAARTAAKDQSLFEANVTALEAAMPEQVTAMDIIAKPGVRYVEAGDYEEFIAEKFGVAATVATNEIDGAWELRSANGSPKFTPEVRFSYATADRTPLALLQSLMNNRTIVIRRTITDSNGNEKQVKDVKATLEARDKAAKIAEDFGTWIFTDAARAERITATYNAMFNSQASPDYKAAGEALSFPGLNADYTPHHYQRSAVARILNEPTVLIDHVVGAGKTGTMVMGAMELRRTGIANKPAIVVPNHLVDQVSRDFVDWYPSANVLSVPTGINASERAFWVAAAATGDWDAVVIPQTVFAKIQVDPAKTQIWLEEQITELRASKAKMSGEEKARIKAIERAIKRLEERHARITTGKDVGVTFEETGIDYLFVDEAHHFKNLFRQSDSYELACTGSDRASDLDFKLRSLRESKTEDAIRGGYYREGYLPAVATFATGTPVANSMSEMWVMQHYLRPDLLARAGLEDVNSWANQFTERSTVLRISPAGGGYDQVERINKYINLPELLKITNQFSDVVTVSDITAKLPTLEGKDRQLAKRHPSAAVVEYVKDLGERAKNLSGVDPKEDNMPKITNDGRMVALDPRLKGLPGDPDGGRPNEVAAEVWGIHQKTREKVFTTPDGRPSETTGALQLLFCDRAVPNSEGRFSMYESIKAELVSLGMDPERIAFIHDAATDAARKELFARCRDGRVNVLIGSTEKMGTGTNVQDRAVALHHVDVPWRPADLEQREGRVLRQGNQNDVVSIHFYATAETFDVYMWDMVARKAEFINQLKRGDVQGRTMDDGFGDLELSAGQAAAALSGDPRLEQLASLQMEESRLQSLHRSYLDAQRRGKGELAITRSALASISQELPVISAAAAAYTSTSGDWFRMTVDGTVHLSRADAGAALRRLVLSRIQPLPAGAGPYQKLGTLGGLSVEGRYHRGLEYRIGGSEAATVHVDWDALVTAEPLGMLRRLENTAAATADIRDDLRAKQAAHEAAVPSLEDTIARPFDHAAELAGVQLKIADLMNDMGLNQDTDDTDTEAPAVMGQTLSLLAGDLRNVHASDLRDGDVVTGVPGRGQALFRVETAIRFEKVVVHELAETDEAPEPLNLSPYASVELVSRPQTSLTPFERVFLDVPETDAVTTADADVKTGERITLQRPALNPDTRLPTGRTVMVTGTVQVSSNEWVVTDDHGAKHAFGYNRWGNAGSPVLRHGVLDPEQLAAEAAKEAAQAAVVRADMFLPGDVLLENVDGLGQRGDVAVGRSLYHGPRFADPVTGDARETQGRYVPRVVAYQPGRFVTVEETTTLFPDNYGPTIAELRCGDVVSAHQLDRNQARRDNVTVTGVGGGTMVDLNYRFEDGATGTCRRRSDQKISVHARRYGALTELEKASLQAPGTVTGISAGSLNSELQGRWVRMNATKGETSVWNKGLYVTGQLVEVTKVPAANRYAQATMRVVVEEPGGARTRWALLENSEVLLWEGELPETPLDHTGMDVSFPVGPIDPPAAPEDAIIDGGTFLSDHLTATTVNLGPALAHSETPAPAAASADGGGVAPVLEHTADGSSMTGVGRDATVLHGLLKDAGFKFSRRQELWYLNSTWKPETRDVKVRQLLSAAERKDIAIDIEDPGPTRRMALLKEGDGIRIAPGTAVIHGVDGFGIHQTFDPSYELVAEVAEGRISSHRVPVRVNVAGRSHSFEVSHESGALEVVSPSETEDWQTGYGPAMVPWVSTDLDARYGRKVRDLDPGQCVSLTGKEISLQELKSFQRTRFDDATVLAVHRGPVEHIRYVLLEQEQTRVWVEATAADTVPVHKTTTTSGKGFTPPRFSIRHVNDVPLGEDVCATGFKPTDNDRYHQIVTATGALTGVHERASGEYDLSIRTDQGLVSIRQGEQHGYAPEVTTLTPGTTTEPTAPDKPEGPEVEFAPDPLHLVQESSGPAL